MRRPRSARCSRLVLACATFAVLLAAPAGADAAKVRVGGGPVTVSPRGIAPIAVNNPNRSRARGSLTLRSAGKAVGRAAFSIPARRRKTVRIALTNEGFKALGSRGALLVQAVAKARRIGTTRKRLRLQQRGGPPGGGGPAWTDGRYQGTYAENNADLAFNVVGTRLFTGPFDAFYLDATCQNVDPEYTGNQTYTDASAIEPVEATIAADGRFSGTGVYRPGFGQEINWTLTGRIAGGSITDAAFSATYTDYGGNPCSGTTRFVAQWYGSYTL